MSKLTRVREGRHEQRFSARVDRGRLRQAFRSRSRPSRSATHVGSWPSLGGSEPESQVASRSPAKVRRPERRRPREARTPIALVGASEVELERHFACRCPVTQLQRAIGAQIQARIWRKSGRWQRRAECLPIDVFGHLEVEASIGVRLGSVSQGGRKRRACTRRKAAVGRAHGAQRRAHRRFAAVRRALPGRSAAMRARPASVSFGADPPRPRRAHRARVSLRSATRSSVNHRSPPLHRTASSQTWKVIRGSEARAFIAHL